MTQTDTLGRATFRNIAPQAYTRPTNREIRWFQHIARHGPQSSRHLFELTRDTHRCKDTSLRQMQKLRAGGFLALPRQQRATEHAEFNPYIYDLTAQAMDYLQAYGLAEPTLRPTGHWWHSYATASFTGSLDILAARLGIEYIPGHTILALKGAELGIPIAGQRLIPDHLFALKYAEGYRACMLEIDRGTEPFTSTAARKRLDHSIDQYLEVFENGLPRQHYGLKATTLSLWVFEHSGRYLRFLERLEDRRSQSKGRILAKLWAGPTSRWSEVAKVQGSAWVSGDGKSVDLLRQ